MIEDAQRFIAGVFLVGGLIKRLRINLDAKLAAQLLDALALLAMLVSFSATVSPSGAPDSSISSSSLARAPVSFAQR